MKVNRPIMRYHGGKWKMAKTIIKHFPHHRVYTEVFGGAGSILLQKPRSYAEIYNDAFGDVVNVFRVLRNQEMAERLKELCELTPFARDEFNTEIERGEPIEWARGVIFRSFSGFGSAAASSSGSKTGFRSNSNRSGTTPAHDWKNWPKHVVDYVERLRGVVIENKQAISILLQHDTPNTLHYIDPPYMKETRSEYSCTNSYEYEMTTENHSELLETIKKLKGKVILSGYRNELYNEALKDWRRVDFGALADGAKKRTESLWMNYDPPCPTLFEDIS